MQLLRNLIKTELKAMAFFFFLPFGVALGILMLVWHVFDIYPPSDDRKEYIEMLKWDIDFIETSIQKPFQTMLNGICEFIADAFIIPRQTASTRKKL